MLGLLVHGVLNVLCYLADPKCVSKFPHASSINRYITRDEKFGQSKLPDVVSQGLIAISQLALNEHDGEISKIYEEGLELPGLPFSVKFPIPDMIKGA